MYQISDYNGINGAKYIMNLINNNKFKNYDRTKLKRICEGGDYQCGIDRIKLIRLLYFIIKKN